MNDFFGFLISPIGIIFLIAIFAIFLLFFAINQRDIKRYKVVIEYFKGQFSPLNTYSFNFKNKIYSISQISRGGGAYASSGGSYPVLSTLLSLEHPQFYIGNKSCVKYWFIQKQVEPNVILFENLLIGTHDAALTEKLHTILKSDLELKKSLEEVLKDDFGILKLEKEWLIIPPFLIQRKNVLSFVGIDKRFLEDPKILENQLLIIEKVLIAFGMNQTSAT
jgi:hypothetical protein